MESYIKTANMQAGYQKKVIIKDVNINIEKGQIITVIGPNGAGKSTILKSMARQLQLIGGSIYLDGKDIYNITASDLSKKMAIVFTERLKGDMMTCMDVVATGRYPYTGRFGTLSEEDNKIVNEAMELVNVSNLKDYDFDKISDGQRQRVMLARAICQEPEVIIMDEPTSFLDIKHKIEFMSLLQELRNKKELTVIMSVHELELAQRVSDKIVCLNGDTVDRIGTPNEIFVDGYIKNLFHIETGNFDEEDTCMELKKPEGMAETFVIAGGGKGRHIYRYLQRNNIPFITGIIYDNDLDYPVARALSSKVICEKAFEEVNEDKVNEAIRVLKDCKHVISCKESFGTFEKFNEEILAYAKGNGIKITIM